MTTAQIDMSHQAVLHRLLKSIFTHVEIRQLMTYWKPTSHLVSGFPDASVSLDVFLFYLVGALQRGGLINDGLFALLKTERPGRIADILIAQRQVTQNASAPIEEMPPGMKGHLRPEAVDIVIATALTEENQVVRAVLDTKAKRIGVRGGAPVWEYTTEDGERYEIASVSAHAIGAPSMALAAARWLEELAPEFAVLVGIAAAVNTQGLRIGDVPLATEVIGYGDIAVENRRLTFRTSGFSVDSRLKYAAGELRSDIKPYLAWQRDCRSAIGLIVSTLNALRQEKVVYDEDAFEAPHFIVGVAGSGPFLLRDADFRDKLRNFPKGLPTTKIRGFDITGPLHPKLVSTEMEAYGFMEACRNYEVPGSVLKGISDLGDSGKSKLEANSGGFFRAYACSNAVLALLHMLALRPRIGGPGVGRSRRLA